MLRLKQYIVLHFNRTTISSAKKTEAQVLGSLTKHLPHHSSDPVHEYHQQDWRHGTTLVKSNTNWKHVWPFVKYTDTVLMWLLIKGLDRSLYWSRCPILLHYPPLDTPGATLIGLLQVYKTHVDWMRKLPWPPSKRARVNCWSSVPRREGHSHFVLCYNSSQNPCGTCCKLQSCCLNDGMFVSRYNTVWFYTGAVVWCHECFNGVLHFFFFFFSFVCNYWRIANQL